MDNKITKKYLQNLVKDHIQYDKTIEPIIQEIDKYLVDCAKKGQTSCSYKFYEDIPEDIIEKIRNYYIKERKLTVIYGTDPHVDWWLEDFYYTENKKILMFSWS